MNSDGDSIMQDEDRLKTYRYLFEHPELFDAISEATGDELRIQQALRSRFPDDAVRLALTIAALRKRAAGKFPHAASMWFDRERLEQATSWAVAVHKAARLEGQVWDYC